jgi:hypothetical protein
MIFERLGFRCASVECAPEYVIDVVDVYLEAQPVAARIAASNFFRLVGVIRDHQPRIANHDDRNQQPAMHLASEIFLGAKRGLVEMHGGGGIHDPQERVQRMIAFWCRLRSHRASPSLTRVSAASGESAAIDVVVLEEMARPKRFELLTF